MMSWQFAIFLSSDIITVVNFEDRLFTVVVTCKHPIFVKKKNRKRKKENI